MALQKNKRPSALTVAFQNQPLIDIKAYTLALEEIMFGQPRPSSVELEEAVLGAILTDKKAFIRINFLEPKNFYNLNNAIIFSSIKKMIENQDAIDILTVVNHLKSVRKFDILWSYENVALTGDNALEWIGGVNTIVEITNKVASSANIEYHARIVMQKFYAREMMQFCAEGIVKAARGEEDIFDLRSRIKQSLTLAPINSYFDVRTIEQVYEDADNMPEMVLLAGNLLRRGEMSFMFAPPGVGKSILAVQIGKALSEGADTIDGILINEHKQAMKVGFVDMELFDNEFAKRYTDKADRSRRVKFNENFIRISPARNFVVKQGQELEVIIRNHLEAIIDTQKIEVLIVDNITALTSSSSSDNTVAIELMRWLSGIRAQKNLSILVLGHTTKYLNKTMPMAQSDMKGAGEIMAFAPTAFGIREAPALPGSLYIKSVKGRNDEVNDRDTVVVVTPTMQNDLFLSMEFNKFCKEDELLSSFLEAEAQDDIVLSAIKMKIDNPYMGTRELVKELGCQWSHTTLGNRMKEYCKDSKQYEFQPGGNIIKHDVKETDELDTPKQDDAAVLNSQRTPPETLPF